MRLFLMSAAFAALCVVGASPAMGQDGDPTATVGHAVPAAPAPHAAGRGPSGSIFQAGLPYSQLTNGQRATTIGDVITIVLAERTQGAVTNSSGIEREGGIGLTPPATGPLSLFSPSDTQASADTSFAGRGASAQSNELSGEITAHVIGVMTNGNLLIRGEKNIRINRSDETITVSGIVRVADIAADNRVLSTRLADPEIAYSGRGEIARASRQGWLQRFFTRISPF
jgi:flagellar L-ring protein precursor FlgH